MAHPDEQPQDNSSPNNGALLQSPPPASSASSGPAAPGPRGPSGGQPPPPAPRKRGRTLTAAAVILLLAAGGWYWYHHRQAASAPAGSAPGDRVPSGARGPGGPAGAGGPGGPFGLGGPGSAPVVVAATAASRDMPVVLNGLGNVTPVANVTVRAQVSGPLLKVLFQEGQMVKAGDILAEIDARPFQATLDQALGQLARDQALLQNARIDQQRYQTLLGQDSTTKQQVDTQNALVRQYEGVVKTDQGNVDSARIQLGYTHIKAPVSGRIGLRQVDAGNIVSTSDTNGVALITQIAPIAVLFTIPEDNLPAVLRKLNAGETLPVEAWDRQMRNKLSEGNLLTTDNQIDTTTGTVKLKAVFKNADGMLFPNQFVNTRMRVDTIKDATVVPVAAIQRGQQGNFVYLIDADGKVKVQVVTLGPSDGTNTVILKGMEPGQRVVVDGADRLKEGITVQTVEPAARAAAASAPANPQQHRRRRDGAGGASGPAANASEADRQRSRERRGSASAPAVPPPGSPGAAQSPAPSPQ